MNEIRNQKKISHQYFKDNDIFVSLRDIETNNIHYEMLEGNFLYNDKGYSIVIGFYDAGFTVITCSIGIIKEIEEKEKLLTILNQLNHNSLLVKFYCDNKFRILMECNYIYEDEQFSAELIVEYISILIDTIGLCIEKISKYIE